MKIKIYIVFIFIIILVSEYNCSFLKAASSSLDSEMNSNNYSNELVPGLNDVNKLKKIIQSLVVKLDEMEEKKSQGPHFKYLEIKMPQKGKELKIKHNLTVEDVISVNVMILNGISNNLIMRSQVDLISQKVLYNWYIDKDNFVIIRPNNLDFKDNIFLDNSKLRIVFTLK